MARKHYDLGKDNLWKLAFMLTIPTALAQLVNVLYAIIDRMYIGHIAGYGDIALAGVGVAAPITTLLSAFTALIGLGGGPIMAMREGHGERDKAEQILATAFYMFIAVSAVVTPLAFIFRDNLLIAFGASSETLVYASQYLGIYALGTPFALLSVGMNSYLINQGKSGVAMISVLSGATLNIILDPIFIFPLGLGVRGAAIASVISQLAAATITISALISRKTDVRLRFNAFSRLYISKIAKYGVSPFIILSTDSLLLIALNTMLQKYGGATKGDILITCSTIVQSFFLIINNPLSGMSSGGQGLISHNYGAGNSERVRKSILILQTIQTTYCILMMIFAYTSSSLFVRLFTSDPVLIDLSVHYIRIFVMMIIPLSFQFCNVDSMTALGQVRYSLPLSLFRKTTFFVCTLLLPVFFSADAAFFAEPISDLTAGIISSIVMWTHLGRILKKRESSGLVI